MSKFTDFYAKALSDKGTKKELGVILGGKGLDKANDEQLEKVGAVAKKLGFDITVAEAREFLKSDKKLDEDDLDAVAGGSDKSSEDPTEGNPCQLGIDIPGVSSLHRA